MSLSLNTNISSGNVPLTKLGSNISLKNSFQHLKQRNLINSEHSGLNVSFSARYNSNLTAYLAGGRVSSLLKGLEPDANVHRLSPLNVGKLL